MKVIRVLMVDDSPEFLEATGNFLDIFPHIEVVGQVLKGKEIFNAVEKLAPDLVLLDLALPDIHGLVLLEEIQKLPNFPPVLVVTFFNDPEYQQKALNFGAVGYLLKGDLAGEIIPTINDLFNINNRTRKNDQVLNTASG